MQIPFRFFAPVLFAFFLVAPTAFAATPLAGLPRDLIWFSKDPFFAGEEVSIYTTLFNSTPYRFTGKVTLSDGATAIDTQTFTLEPSGTSVVLAFPWVATKGEHAFSVKVTEEKFASGEKMITNIPVSGSGAVALKRMVETPPPPPVVKTVTENTIPQNEGTSTEATATTKVTNLPILSTIETFRREQIEKNTERIDEIKGGLESQGLPTDLTDAVLLVTTTEGREALGGGESGPEMLRTPWQYVKLFFSYCYRFATEHVYIFYIVLLLVAYKIIRAIMGLVL